MPCRGIDRQSPHFLRALTLTADIHLKHKRDPAGYVQCYSQLAEQHRDYESYRLLGSALLRIQEPERAIQAGCAPRFSLSPAHHLSTLPRTAAAAAAAASVTVTVCSSACSQRSNSNVKQPIKQEDRKCRA